MSESNCHPSSQWGRPRGLVGSLVGWVMAVKNTAMNRAAVTALDLTPSDRVLEIGCGPGVALTMVDSRAAYAAGLDHSPVMVAQATWRNRRAIAEGRIAVVEASVARLPFPEADFDKVFTVNSFHFWPAPEAALAEARRVLKPDGRVVLAIRASNRPLAFDVAGAAKGAERARRAQQALATAGFAKITTEEHHAGRLIALCVIARKSTAV